MDAKRLVELRRQAEHAVAEMPDGELKVKAFEVILNHLMGYSDFGQAKPAEIERDRTAKPTKGKPAARSASGRIMVLRDEGFFKNQRSIGEIREELRAHGWHYPLTTLSGIMQALVQRRNLRRERAKKGNQRIWKYSNP